MPKRSEERCRSDGGRKLLAMVAGIEKGQVRLRTLIDLGGPNDPDLVQGAALASMVQGMMGMAPVSRES